MDERAAKRGLAFLRIAFGVWLVWTALPNLDHSFIERMPFTLESFSAGNPYPLVRWLIQQVAYPNVEHVGLAVSVGQALVGTAVALGFLTRIVALAGAVFAAMMVLAAGHLTPYHMGFSMLMLLLFSGLWVADAGRCYGFDGFLFRTADAGGKKDKGGKAATKPKFKNKQQKEAVEALSKKLKAKSGGKKKDKVSSK